MSPWQPYIPNEQEPWDKRRVIHLHRRAVFGPSQSEVERDLQDDPQTAVTRILEGTCRTAQVSPDFATTAELIASAAEQSENPDRLKASWVYRCLLGPDPLRERLTFMWHNHFATSNRKVGSLVLMKRQNDSLRQFARSEFSKLLTAMLQDPALLVWLDADANRSGHPNENLARELLELFTLGIGHYTEADVKVAARALTGISIRDGEFAFIEARHDSTSKSILGKSGEFQSTDMASLLLEHPATSRRLAWRLTSEFFGEDVVPETAIDELASRISESDLNIGAAVETILRSRLFFSEANIGTRVCDPMTFLIAPLRALEIMEPPPDTMMLASWLGRMGLDLFYPPNVGGWAGGRAWLNTRTMIARANYAAAIVNGDLGGHQPNPTIAGAAAALLGLSNESPEIEFKWLVNSMATPAAHVM